MICKTCDNDEFYFLKNNYIKCKKCNKKYSLNKIDLENKIIDSFIENKNANETSKLLNVNYRTIKNRFDFYRINLLSYLNDFYNNNYQSFSDYQERKVIINKYKNSTINIMGFTNGVDVYTILMPSHSIDINNNKIQSSKFYETKLYEFWNYLELNLKKYKGIKDDRLILYIKEYEFKFNFSKSKQKEILSNF